MPWRLREALPPNANNPQDTAVAADPNDLDLYTQIKSQWPERMDSAYKSMFALGIDAYRLTQLLNQPLMIDTPLMAGETGTLYVDSRGIIHRRLRKASFHKGLPRLLHETTDPATLEESLPSADYYSQ
jgi:hypothetical protein